VLAYVLQFDCRAAVAPCGSTRGFRFGAIGLADGLLGPFAGAFSADLRAAYLATENYSRDLVLMAGHFSGPCLAPQCH
jgi:hypothetical protein